MDSCVNTGLKLRWTHILLFPQTSDVICSKILSGTDIYLQKTDLSDRARFINQFKGFENYFETSVIIYSWVCFGKSILLQNLNSL